MSGSATVPKNASEYTGEENDRNVCGHIWKSMTFFNLCIVRDVTCSLAVFLMSLEVRQLYVIWKEVVEKYNFGQPARIGWL